MGRFSTAPDEVVDEPIPEEVPGGRFNSTPDGEDPAKEHFGLHLAKNLAHYVDLFNHLGQPDWAKHLVENVRGDQTREDNSKGSAIERYVTKPISNDVKDLRNIAAAGVDAATSPTTYALPVLGKGVGMLAGKTTPLIAKGASSISGVSPEAITEAAWTNPGGRAGMKAAAEGFDEAGPRMSGAMEGFYANLPEHEIVNEALSKTPNVSVQPAIDALENYKSKYIKNITGEHLPSHKADIKAIDADIKFLKGKNKESALRVQPADKALNGRALLGGEGIEGGTTIKSSDAPEKFSSGGLLYEKIKSGYGNTPTYRMPNGKAMQFRGDETFHLDPNQAEALKTAGKLNEAKVINGEENPNKYTYSAEDVYQIRKYLDDNIDFKTRLPVSDNIQRSRIEARTALKNALIESAPPEYADAMKSWSEKLDVKSRLEEMVRNGTDLGSDRKAANFLASIWKKTPDAKVRRDALIEFDRAAGTDFLGESKRAFLADQKGYNAKPWDAPKDHGILHSLGKFAGSAGGSHVAVPIAQGTDRLLGVSGRAATNTVVIARLTDAISKTKSPEKKAALERKLAELENK